MQRNNDTQDQVIQAQRNYCKMAAQVIRIGEPAKYGCRLPGTVSTKPQLLAYAVGDIHRLW
jgi:hypothetical protein